MDHQNWRAAIPFVHIVYGQSIKMDPSLLVRVSVEVRPGLSYHPPSIPRKTPDCRGERRQNREYRTGVTGSASGGLFEKLVLGCS